MPARMYEVIDAGAVDNNCFCLAVSNALGRSAETYEAAIYRKAGEMVDIGALVAHQQGTINNDSQQEVSALIELLHNDAVCLQIYLGAQGEFNSSRSVVMFPVDEPIVSLGKMTDRKVKLLFDRAHYSRLVATGNEKSKENPVEVKSRNINRQEKDEVSRGIQQKAETNKPDEQSRMDLSDLQMAADRLAACIRELQIQQQSQSND